MTRRLRRLGWTLAVAVVFVAAATEGPAETRGLTLKVRASDRTDAPVIEEVNLYGASHALVIGIDDYTGGWPKLSNAVRDADLVAGAMSDRGFDVTFRKNLTAADLDRTLREFFVVKGADPSARLFVWYAGHGHTLDGEGFLVPADAPRPTAVARFKLAALPIRRFGEYVRLAESKHVFSVFDSCFAGTVFDSPRALPPAAITRATTLPVRQFLTSGDADQTVSDDGTFRELFLRALDGEEKADANGDGYITASEIGLYLTDRVTNLTGARQTPRYGKLRDKDWDRGDFVFALAGAALTATSVARPGPATASSAEVVFWQSIKDSTKRDDFDAYLRRFPDGTFAELARNRVASLGDAKSRFEIDLVQHGENYVVTKTANVRASPSTAGTTLAQIAVGTRVRVTGKVRGGDWYRIQHDALGQGYLHASVVGYMWYAGMAATFEGRLGNPVRPQQQDRVVTRLEFRDGRLEGTYTIHEPKAETRGRLGDFQATGPRSGTFRWQDEYGAGKLSIVFDPELTSFEGRWEPEGQPGGGGLWTGRR